jgi:hypothetical protein
MAIACFRFKVQVVGGSKSRPATTAWRGHYCGVSACRCADRFAGAGDAIAAPLKLRYSRVASSPNLSRFLGYLVCESILPVVELEGTNIVLIATAQWHEVVQFELHLLIQEIAFQIGLHAFSFTS